MALVSAGAFIMSDATLNTDLPTGVKMEDIMSEQITPTPEVTPAPTPTPAVTTQQQAVNVDVNSILLQAEAKATEVAEKKADAVMRSMLKENGFDDDTIKSMIAEHRAKQTTPEQEIKLRDDAIGTLTQQLEAERQEKAALAKGVPLGSDDEATKAKAAACITLAKSYVSDDVTFEAALDRAMQIISFAPPETKPEAKPPMWGGAGTKPIGGTEIDAMKAEYEIARKNRDGAKMSFLVRKAQEKNIQLP